jgi:hypothetical protein
MMTSFPESTVCIGQQMAKKRFEILYGTRAVWINDAEGCLGRFGINGIDVHQTIQKQEAGEPQCLYCTHAPVTSADWPRFVNAMLEFHRIDIRNQPAPDWL